MLITEMSTEQRKKMREKSKIETEAKIKKFCEENPKLAAYVKNCPVSYRKRYIDSLIDEKAKSNAVKMKCLECSGWDRDEVKICAVKSCPLWQVRPYK